MSGCMETTMFIQTEATPNPATLKFLPGKVVLENGTADFRDAGRGGASRRWPGACSTSRASPACSSAMISSPSPRTTPDWQHLKPAILGTHHGAFHVRRAGHGACGNQPEIADVDGEFFDEADETIVATIKELLETRVRPAVAQDGGDITFRGFRDGTVFLNMKGACAGCPSSTATLKHGIQNLLRHFIPEVQEVEPV